MAAGARGTFRRQNFTSPTTSFSSLPNPMRYTGAVMNGGRPSASSSGPGRISLPTRYAGVAPMPCGSDASSPPAAALAAASSATGSISSSSSSSAFTSTFFAGLFPSSVPVSSDKPSAIDAEEMVPSLPIFFPMNAHASFSASSSSFVGPPPLAPGSGVSVATPTTGAAPSRLSRTRRFKPGSTLSSVGNFARMCSISPL